MNLINQEEVVEVIKRFTGKTKEEIIHFVENNTIKYSDLRTFAALAGDFPTEAQCKIIGNRGIDICIGETFGFDALNALK